MTSRSLNLLAIMNLLVIMNLLAIAVLCLLPTTGCDQHNYEPGWDDVGSILIDEGRYYIDARYIDLNKKDKTIVTSIVAISTKGMPSIFHRDKGVYSVNGKNYKFKRGDNLIILNGKSKRLGPIPIDSTRDVIDDFVRFHHSKP